MWNPADNWYLCCVVASPSDHNIDPIQLVRWLNPWTDLIFKFSNLFFQFCRESAAQYLAHRTIFLFNLSSTSSECSRKKSGEKNYRLVKFKKNCNVASMPSNSKGRKSGVRLLLLLVHRRCLSRRSHSEEQVSFCFAAVLIDIASKGITHMHWQSRAAFFSVASSLQYDAWTTVTSTGV